MRILIQYKIRYSRDDLGSSYLEAKFINLSMKVDFLTIFY